MQPTIYFCGVWPGRTAGHYTYDTHGNKLWNEHTPWRNEYMSRPMCDARITALLPPGTRDNKQIERVRHHFQSGGWTLIAWWDRSGDCRFGSIAAFAINALLDADAAEQYARQVFDNIFKRMDKYR